MQGQVADRLQPAQPDGYKSIETRKSIILDKKDMALQVILFTRSRDMKPLALHLRESAQGQTGAPLPTRTGVHRLAPLARVYKGHSPASCEYEHASIGHDGVRRLAKGAHAHRKSPLPFITANPGVVIAS